MELWLVYATGAAVFAALTTILAKIGVRDVDSHLATAIRTIVVLIFAWLMVFIVGSIDWDISIKTWIFLLLSGLATGGSWLCYFRALKLGNVNKVVPIDKCSTILTMILAFIFLAEPLGFVTGVGMLLMAVGTWLMLEIKKTAPEKSPGRWFEMGWLFYAVLAAIFASLVAIFGKIGIADMDPTLWTALRTIVVIPMSWLMVFTAGSQKTIKTIAPRSWVFLILSGVATGASWLFFYHALRIGNASLVVPIDKLSILLVMGFAWLFLGERFTRRGVVGLGLLTLGTLLPVFV